MNLIDYIKGHANCSAKDISIAFDKGKSTVSKELKVLLKHPSIHRARTKKHGTPFRYYWWDESYKDADWLANELTIRSAPDIGRACGVTQRSIQRYAAKLC